LEYAKTIGAIGEIALRTMRAIWELGHLSSSSIIFTWRISSYFILPDFETHSPLDSRIFREWSLEDGDRALNHDCVTLLSVSLPISVSFSQVDRSWVKKCFDKCSVRIIEFFSSIHVSLPSHKFPQRDDETS
jgi:hypothetical protein